MSNTGLEVITRSLTSVETFVLDGPSQLTSAGLALVGRMASLTDLTLRVGPPNNVSPGTSLCS